MERSYFPSKENDIFKLKNHIELPFGKWNLSEFEFFKDFTEFKETQPE
jgi:hypothetical protein